MSKTPALSNLPFLQYGRQRIDEDDIAAVVAVLRGDFLTQGPYVAQFEAAVCEYTGARHAVAVSSGTAALHIAALAAELGPGTSAVVPAITFVATANAVVYAGGGVVLADIDSHDLGMASAALEQVLRCNPEIKAVLPVHMAGLAARSKELRALAGDRLIIEDASHSLGGSYESGERVGSCAYADMTVFSFHPVKTVTTGEGGMVTTNDDGFAHRLRALRNHGIEREPQRLHRSALAAQSPWYYEQQLLGFNYRLSDIHAVLGLSQTRKIDEHVNRRREIAQSYDEGLATTPVLTRMQSQSSSRKHSSHHLYIVNIDFDALGGSRGEFMATLRAAGIGSQVHYIPVHHHPFHAACGEERGASLANAEQYYRRALSLPIHPGLSDEDVERIISTLNTVCAI